MRPLIELARNAWLARVHNSRGQAMTEYALIVALIAIAYSVMESAFSGYVGRIARYTNNCNKIGAASLTLMYTYAIFYYEK